MPSTFKASVWQGWFPILSASILSIAALLTTGCGDSQSGQQANAVTHDPEGELEWGLERLRHALRNFSPSSSDGLSVSKRQVASEIFPPTKEKKNYTARVTVTSETSFLHGRRKMKSPKEEEAAPEEEPKLLDPLADQTEDLSKLVKIPGVGPQAPPPAAKIDTRRVENKTVFDLAYLDGRWKLTEEPELEYEKLWFKYAFE